MRDSKAWTIAFSAILSFVCAAALTLVSGYAKPLYKENRRLERLALTLRALGVPIPEGETVAQVYEASVKEAEAGGVAYLEYWKEGRLEAVALDAEGQGLWSTIRAYLALEPGLDRIRSIAFYEQEETPGLGAEIATDAFQSRFKGKRLLGASGERLVRIVKPGNARGEEVDGISGATLTGEGVDELLENVAGMVRALRKARAMKGGGPSGASGPAGSRGTGG